MSINFNHTIVYARDSRASATFLAEILGLAAPRRWGPFQVVTTDNVANIDFLDADCEITPQHYAFLVSESEFDGIFDRVRERSLPPTGTPSRSLLVLTAAALKSVMALCLSDDGSRYQRLPKARERSVGSAPCGPGRKPEPPRLASRISNRLIAPAPGA